MLQTVVQEGVREFHLLFCKDHRAMVLVSKERDETGMCGEWEKVVC